MSIMIGSNAETPHTKQPLTIAPPISRPSKRGRAVATLELEEKARRATRRDFENGDRDEQEGMNNPTNGNRLNHYDGQTGGYYFGRK